MEDENIKKAKQAVEFTMMQERAKKLQEQFSALSNKVYKGKRQGINIQMKGDYQVLDITIDQSFYETSSKTQTSSYDMFDQFKTSYRLRARTA